MITNIIAKIRATECTLIFKYDVDGSLIIKLIDRETQNTNQTKLLPNEITDEKIKSTISLGIMNINHKST